MKWRYAWRQGGEPCQHSSSTALATHQSLAASAMKLPLLSLLNGYVALLGPSHLGTPRHVDSSSCCLSFPQSPDVPDEQRMALSKHARLAMCVVHLAARQRQVKPDAS